MTTERAAVIDIGSNSIRLVAFSAISRAPQVLFNEKVMCALGRGIAQTGRLNPVGVDLAYLNLSRFAMLARAMKVAHLDIVATAAVREAEDGTAFVSEVERLVDHPVRVLSGADEASLSALGLVSAIPDADGVLGDLGGGSLELVDSDHGTLGAYATLPLGPLRLIDETDGNLRRARGVIVEALRSLPWLTRLSGRNFYAVGGAWRNFARLLMELDRYPLHVIHHYRVDAARLGGLIAAYRGLTRDELKRVPDLSRRRLEILPLAVLVLEQIFDIANPAALVFSAAGLREGVIFAKLPRAEQRRDPLIAAVQQIAGTGRFPLHEPELYAFLAPALGPFAPPLDRLVRAACILSDIAWTEHPDYRGEHSFWRILRLPIVGIEHSERAFLALASATRYGADGNAPYIGLARRLLDPAMAALATQIGAALRLAYSISGGAPSLLARSILQSTDGALTLTVPSDRSVVTGDAVIRRLETLARLCQMDHRVEHADPNDRAA